MKTISEYSIFVSELAKNRENRIFLNSDEEHGLIVYVNLLKSAKNKYVFSLVDYVSILETNQNL